jgi:hypothetical protein
LLFSVGCSINVYYSKVVFRGYDPWEQSVLGFCLVEWCSSDPLILFCFNLGSSWWFDHDKGGEGIWTLRSSSMYWDHASKMIPIGFVVIYCSLSIITWLVGYGFLISVRKRVRAVILISSAIAFISGSTFTFIFG